MKYKEWTGDLEGALPDIGLVTKGRVLLIDTEGKETALEPYKNSLKTLSKEESEKRYLSQQKAEGKAEEAETEKSAEPEAAPQATATEAPAEPATTTDASPAKPSPKGGRP